jgi:hypothetical protein
MNKQTFSFPAMGGIIPNVSNPASPNGEFHAGQEVDVDLDTMTVLEVRLIHTPVEEVHGNQNIPLDEQPTQEFASINEAKTKKGAK